jgi:threonine dehydrogenase-like Zn-dependent dehydrogenase
VVGTVMNGTMKGYVFAGDNRAELRDVPVPAIGDGEALVRMRLASICATDLKIIDGRLPGHPGTVLGHELVGEVVALGPGVTGYDIGQRVYVPGDTPCGQCDECLGNANGRGCHADGTIAGFHFAVLRDGAHAEYVAVPYAQANLAPIPEGVTDEQAVVMTCGGSTGFAGIESSELRMGDTVAIVGQGPVGLAATVAARLRGAGYVITTDVIPWRLEMSRRMGADVALDARHVDIVEEVRHLTGGWMADVAVEAVGMPDTFLTALRLTRPAGVLSSIGNYGMQGSLTVPLDAGAFMGGIGEKKIITTTSPGGKDRGRRLMHMIAHGKFDLSPLVTHRFHLDEIGAAYELFRNRPEPVFKVAIRP